MKTIQNTPTFPLRIENNQYLPNGFGKPAASYYYIVDANGLIFHIHDKKWRSKSLIEMNKFVYRTESSAKISMDYLTERFYV